MSTNGALGIGNSYIYNHFDSYPANLGKRFARYLTRTNGKPTLEGLARLSSGHGTTDPDRMSASDANQLEWTYSYDKGTITVRNYGRIVFKGRLKQFKEWLEYAGQYDD